MGVVRTQEQINDSSITVELKKLNRSMLAATSGLNRRKDKEEFKFPVKPISDFEDEIQQKLVCVTSGASLLGSAIVDKLLARGYSVRILVHNPEEMEKIRCIECSEEDHEQMRTSNNVDLGAVTTKLTDFKGLMEAFHGCHVVFHTSSFIDPSGLTGYSKSKAEVELKATETVIEACARTPSVRKCVLTSSLLACIWRDPNQDDLPSVVNQDCWSNELFCVNKKLWYALGKLRSEKAAWRVAEESGLRLSTICPGLVTGPDFYQTNPTSTIAYLKGANEMYQSGLLATVDVFKLAEAHVCVYEAMRENGSSGRYLCFDRIIGTEDEAEKLAREMGMKMNMICQNPPRNSSLQFKLSNRKLSNLMSRRARCCYYEG